MNDTPQTVAREIANDPRGAWRRVRFIRVTTKPNSDNVVRYRCDTAGVDAFLILPWCRNREPAQFIGALLEGV